MKFLFYGFQHGHVFTLYRDVHSSAEFEIAACIEDDENRRKELEQNHGIVCDDNGLDYWLQRDVDVVGICDKYGKRGAAVIKALKAGKHVICDKPICTTRAELDEIIALSKEKNLKVGCMLDLRDTRGVKTLKTIFDNNECGPIKNIMFTGNHCLDYAHRPSWYFEKGMHGGTINDIAVHAVDLITYLTGMKFVKVDAARCWNSYADKTPDFKDSATFMARLENGAGVLADVSYSAPSQVFSMPTYWNFKFWCRDALVNYNFVGDEITVYAEGEKAGRVIELVDGKSHYLANFVDDVVANKRTFTDSVLLAMAQTLEIQNCSEVTE